MPPPAARESQASRRLDTPRAAHKFQQESQVAFMEIDGRRRVIIEGVTPEIDGGRFAAKRVAGDTVVVEADIFADGHDLISAVVRYRRPGESEWREERMKALVNDRWRAEFPVEALGFHYFTIEAWIDHFLTWHRDLKKRVDAGQDVSVELLVGREMIDAALGRAKARDQKRLRTYLEEIDGRESADEKAEALFDDDLVALMTRNAGRALATSLGRELRIEVDRGRAGFSSWYELFPRSTAQPGGHGSFGTASAELPRIAAMGFDVVYLPPIHPIGTTHRKGVDNATVAAPEDVGSPWAIGSAEGGHRAIHPQLGTMDDFRAFRTTAESLGMEVALDIAFQASPDHPAVGEHPEWFQKRPDGTIRYAENPPKKYQDIYPFHFESDEWQALWNELRDIFLFWATEGVRIFRVDNPHTKPLPFWEWVIGEVKRTHPDAIFLAEAFTRPKIMYYLAKAGFSQSYTYFAWRNTKEELTEYFTELTTGRVSDFFRPNAWPNTPDILTELLQYGGRPAFLMRLILAATLSANYGIYGPAFERFVGEAKESGSEEYGHSEKYEIKQWGPPDEATTDLIALVNRIRRENRALQQNATLVFHPTSSEHVLCYSKSQGPNIILTVVNLDPQTSRSAWLDLDLGALDVDAERPFQVHDLLSGARHTWHGARSYVQLNPLVIPAHIFRIRRRVRSERDFEYFL
jgi:starch synthase (maltosyl-transferring)